ncbi:MAG TPA: PIG-L family deacetylase [Blastocatellia bacterium]|nr:PIG-L family deacetylase [Blastocatellia bacterium]
MHRRRSRTLPLTALLAVTLTGPPLAGFGPPTDYPAIATSAASTARSVGTGRESTAVNDVVQVEGDASAGVYDRGAAGLGQAIRRLGAVASVLHTGAHPDDESSGLLAYLARGRQARTAYLSLTRGDGGQNLIGPELYEALGVIRTEELLAARRLDGAKQYFTRAYDFGFSKSREEALTKWDKDAVLADMVRVIRTFRPMVIASQWSGTSNDGHGHHQAAGYLTPEAYRAAADPNRYPEQIAEGLRPWKARKLYVSAPDRRQQRPAAQPEAGVVAVNTGEIDPLLGRSYFEVAMQGRSRHRSQDQGAIERRGPQYSRLKLLEASPPPARDEKDIFDGIDTTLTGIAYYADLGAERLKQALAEVQREADAAKSAYKPFSPAETGPIIARGLKRLGEIRATLPTLGLSEQSLYDTDFLLRFKEQDFADALAKSHQVAVDCLADDEVVTPGQTFVVTVTAYSTQRAPAAKVSLSVPAGWSAVEEPQTVSITGDAVVYESRFKVTVANDAEFTEPYWLKAQRKGDMFVPGKGGTGIEPTAPPAVSAIVEFKLDGERVSVIQRAQYRFADKALGEIRHDVKIAPAVSVTTSPAIVISPFSAKPTSRDVSVSLVCNARDGARGTVSVQAPSGWTVTPPEASFDLKRPGERVALMFNLKIPAQNKEGRHELQAVASTQGRQFSRGYQLVAYPHTEPRFVYKDASIVAEVFDVKVAAGLLVGYIEGAGDDFAAALTRLGVNVKTIDASELASGDLSRFDVIVTGIRVYEVRPDVVANNGRLLDYVKRGGTLIVQYNKNEYATGSFAPYPVKMRQTGMPDRVTDETASVMLLDPTHPLFNHPNKITERDFEGWVQERGTYFLSEWDPQFKPLMASHDPGEDPKQGGELIAKYGAGYYVYTGYAWFRQLPVGVPGAYRLIANLVSLPKTVNPRARPRPR